MALTDSLTSYYKFDENAANTTVSDATSTNTGTSTVNTSTLSVAGKINTAFSFDGSTNDYEVGFSTVFGMSETSSSINCWVNLDSTSENGAFVSIGKAESDPGGDGYSIGVGSTTFNDSGNHLIGIYEVVRWFNSGTNIGTGWHMVTLTIDSSGVPSLWLDGTVITSYAGNNARAPTINSYIGGYTQEGTSRHVDAIIDEVGLWTKELSTEEVTSLYNSGSGLAYPFGSEAAPLKIFDVRFG